MQGSVRTLTIWAYGLGVGWETFAGLQVGGFVLLIHASPPPSRADVAARSKRSAMSSEQKWAFCVEVVDPIRSRSES